MNQVLEQHRQEIIETFGFEDLASEKQDELIVKIGEAFLKRLFLATIEKLGNHGSKEYEKLIDNQASVDEVEAFLETKIPNYPVFVRGVMSEFKADMDKHIGVVSV
jgi:Protein of unknown function (DUF5663)